MAYRHIRPVPVVALSPSACAASTGLRYDRIRAAVNDGSLRAFRVGVRTLVLITDFERWLRSHPSAARVVNRV